MANVKLYVTKGDRLENKMENIIVVYWSQTGNTQMMAEAVGKGIEEAGKKAKVVSVGDISADILKDEAVFAMGCPAMGAEELEENEMKPFVEQIKNFGEGKTVGLFGSYGWGDGQWMNDWVSDMTSAGAVVLNGCGIICTDQPDENTITKCINMGKELAALTIA